jgi:hypothetical protein
MSAGLVSRHRAVRGVRSKHPSASPIETCTEAQCELVAGGALLSLYRAARFVPTRARTSFWLSVARLKTFE